jgi:chromosome partitioning protein
MRTIAFVSQKGGCGKSTLAACLAVAAKEAGERVFVLDMDPKKSVVRWGSRRNDPNLPVEAVPAARLPAALTALSKRNMIMGKEFIFLLNQCPPARQLAQQGIAALEAVGSLLRPHIAARADFLEAARTGKGVTEVDPKGAAAQECETFGWISAAGSGPSKLADERSPSPAPQRDGQFSCPASSWSRSRRLIEN